LQGGVADKARHQKVRAKQAGARANKCSVFETLVRSTQLTEYVLE
jgi:hypothetical protein